MKSFISSLFLRLHTVKRGARYVEGTGTENVELRPNVGLAREPLFLKL